MVIGMGRFRVVLILSFVFMIIDVLMHTIYLYVLKHLMQWNEKLNTINSIKACLEWYIYIYIYI